MFIHTTMLMLMGCGCCNRFVVLASRSESSDQWVKRQYSIGLVKPGPAPELNLDGNKFSGEFPHVITKIKTLQTIDISSNRFSGEIPCELQDLPLLKLLRLENNKFTGVLPGLHISKSVNFSVAENNFTGAVPNTLSHLGEEAFVGNPLLCGTPLLPCTYAYNQSYCPAKPVTPIPSIGKYAMCGGGALFLLLFLILLLFPVRRQQRPPTTTLHTNRQGQTSEMFIFPGTELRTGQQGEACFMPIYNLLFILYVLFVWNRRPRPIMG